MRILLVDDDKDFCELMGMTLKRLGHDLTVRHDPTTGLTALRGEKPDIVITDLSMPKGGGKLLYQALRKDPQFQDLPVIVITADPSHLSIYDLLESQPHPKTLIIRKPLDFKQIEVLLRQHQK